VRGNVDIQRAPECMRVKSMRVEVNHKPSQAERHNKAQGSGRSAGLRPGLAAGRRYPESDTDYCVAETGVDHMPIPIYYHFQQRFSVSARKAYEWCTNYAPGDHALMGEQGASRKIERFTERTVILTDTFNVETGNQVEKQKIVQLYPETLFWTSTHISGPAKHSQFIYQILEDDDDASHLDFRGIFVDYAHEKISKEEAAMLAEKECRDDAAAWVLLAQAMEQDLCQR